MRHRHHQHRRGCKHLLENSTPVEIDSSPTPESPAPLEISTPEPPAPVEVSAPEPQRGELDHFLRLARVQGVEAAANAYTKDELVKMMRVNGFTYLNPRSRKIDLAHALTGML